MSNNDWKARLGVVYSTNPDFGYESEPKEEQAALPLSKQHLRIALDKRNRGGKKVTLVSDFVGSEDDLKTLCKDLKTKLGVGGSAKDGLIIIQGDFRARLGEILSAEGYNVKVI